MDKVVSVLSADLQVVQSLPDGRLFFQVVRSCLNLCPVFYLRSLPPAVTEKFATACDGAVMTSVASYLMFPPNWADEAYGAGKRALAQFRKPLRAGGFGLTAAGAILHAAYVAGSGITLCWLATSSYRRRFAEQNPLGVNQPSSSEHSFLRGFAVSRDILVRQCHCVAAENQDPPYPDKSVVLPEPKAMFPQGQEGWQPPRLPAQRLLTSLVREHHPLWGICAGLSGGTPADTSRAAHLSRTCVPVRGGVDSPMQQFNDPKPEGGQLVQSPLSWLATLAGSSTYDGFPRHKFAVFVALVVGLPPPAPFDRCPPKCRCGQEFDLMGHHRLTCKQYHGSVPIRSHDRVVGSLVDVARSAGVGASSNPALVPSHCFSRRKGDIRFSLKDWGGANLQVVGDLTVCHMVKGSPASGRSAEVGQWQPQALQVRYNHKKHKHAKNFANQEVLFVPLVVSTYGVLHEEFLRFLWHLAVVSAAPDAVVMGEVREAGQGLSNRQLLFAKMRSRMSVAAAYAASMRYTGFADVAPLNGSASRYQPSDPSFGSECSLAGIPIGPVSLSGGVGSGVGRQRMGAGGLEFGGGRGGGGGSGGREVAEVGGVGVFVGGSGG